MVCGISMESRVSHMHPLSLSPTDQLARAHALMCLAPKTPQRLPGLLERAVKRVTAMSFSGCCSYPLRALTQRQGAVPSTHSPFGALERSGTGIMAKRGSV